MSLIENLNWRHAVKAYDPTKKVSQEDLNTILESARLAPYFVGLTTVQNYCSGKSGTERKNGSRCIKP